jgi:hypothetical protein
MGIRFRRPGQDASNHKRGDQSRSTFASRLQTRTASGRLNFGALEQTGGEKRILLQKLVPFDFFSKDVRALSDEQFRRDQPGLFAQYQRLWRTVLLDHPFDRDAGIDDERLHRSSRPSRRSTSEGVCCRRLVSLRRSAAKVSKEGSISPIRA